MRETTRIGANMTIRLNPADLSQTRSDLGLTIGTSNGNVIAADSTGLPAINGSQVTALNASNLGSGTVPTARLGTGTASSSTILYGNNTWGAAPVSGLNHLSTATASSSSSLDFVSTITSTYDTYLIVLDHLMTDSNGTNLHFLLSTDNGSSFLSADYADVTNVMRHHSSASNSTTGGRSAAQIELMSSVGNANGQGVSGHIWLFSPKDSSMQPTIRFDLAGSANGVNVQTSDGMGKHESGADHDAFQIKFSSGTIQSGQVRVYGLANS